MHVAGVDGRHHERRRPQAQVFVEQRLVARRLLWTFEARRQHERIFEQRHQAEVFRGGRECRLDARRGAARKRSLHGADAALDSADRRAEIFLGRLLTEEHAEFERKRIEAAGKHDSGAARLRGGLMGIDHPAHPDRLAAEIEIIGAGGRAGRDQFAAIELIGADGGQHRFSLVDHRFQRRGIVGIGLDQSRVGRRADRIAHGCELVQVAPGHRPFRIGFSGIMRRKIFRDELAGEAGSAIDNDVEFRRRLHDRFP